MTDQTEAAEVEALLAVVSELRERHAQGLVRIPSYLWGNIPALLDAAEKFLTADEAAAESRGAETERERIARQIEAVRPQDRGIGSSYNAGRFDAYTSAARIARAATESGS